MLQSYLHKDGAPQYSDTGERLARNIKTGFEQQRREAGLARDELWTKFISRHPVNNGTLNQSGHVLCILLKRNKFSWKEGESI